MPEFITALKEPAGAYALVQADDWEDAAQLAGVALQDNAIQTFPRGLASEAGMAKTFPLGQWLELDRDEAMAPRVEYTPDFRLPDYILARMSQKAHATVGNGGGVVYGVPPENILSLIQEVENRRRQDAAPLDVDELEARLSNTIWGENTADAMALAQKLVTVVRDWMDGTPYTRRTERKSR